MMSDDSSSQNAYSSNPQYSGNNPAAPPLTNNYGTFTGDFYNGFPVYESSTGFTVMSSPIVTYNKITAAQINSLTHWLRQKSMTYFVHLSIDQPGNPFPGAAILVPSLDAPNFKTLAGYNTSYFDTSPNAFKRPYQGTKGPFDVSQPGADNNVTVMPLSADHAYMYGFSYYTYP